ncbi:MAG: glycosyltransferase involved in cell wall biosynthesis [Psychroserpens sp.]
MDITLITSIFESPFHSNRAPYNEQLFLRLSRNANINIIRPISWVEIAKSTKKLSKADYYEGDWNGIPILFPTYYFIPRVGHYISGYCYWLSVYKAFYSTQKIPDVFFSAWVYPDAFATMLLAKKHKKPLVVSVLGSDINVLAQQSDKKRKLQQVLNYASAIFSPSRALADCVVALGVDTAKVHVVHCGIDAQLFFPSDRKICAQQLDIPADKKRIVYIGNFKVAKGIIDYLEAVHKLSKKHTDFEAVIIGKGEDEQLVRNTIAKLDIAPFVRLVGEVNHDKLNIWLNSSDCLCLPSYAEGLPNVVLEALATNTNVVATNVGGIPEAVKNSDRCLMNPGDIDGLTDRLESALYDSSFVTEPGFAIRSYEDMAQQVLELTESAYRGFSQK